MTTFPRLRSSQSTVGDLSSRSEVSTELLFIDSVAEVLNADARHDSDTDGNRKAWLRSTAASFASKLPSNIKLHSAIDDKTVGGGAVLGEGKRKHKQCTSYVVLTAYSNIFYLGSITLDNITLDYLTF